MKTLPVARNPGAHVVGAQIELFALDERHVDTLREWKSDRELADSIATYPREYSADEVRCWLTAGNADSNQVFLGIYRRGTDDLLGVARLMFIDWISRVAELGIYFGKADQRGKGLGKDAVRALLKHAFEDLALERVHLRVRTDNKKAIRCYEQCGFIHEGALRSHFLSNGIRHDMQLMGIVREEFLGMNKSLVEG